LERKASNDFKRNPGSRKRSSTRSMNKHEMKELMQSSNMTVEKCHAQCFNRFTLAEVDEIFHSFCHDSSDHLEEADIDDFIGVIAEKVDVKPRDIPAFIATMRSSIDTAYEGLLSLEEVFSFFYSCISPNKAVVAVINATFQCEVETFVEFTKLIKYPIWKPNEKEKEIHKIKVSKDHFPEVDPINFSSRITYTFPRTLYNNLMLNVNHMMPVSTDSYVYIMICYIYIYIYIGLYENAFVYVLFNE